MKNYYQYVWRIQKDELPLYRFIYSSRLSAGIWFLFQCYSVNPRHIWCNEEYSLHLI